MSPFSNMLKMGKSKPWPEALKKLTGSETLDVGALTEYFEPLRKGMVEQREEIGYAAPGWEDEDDINNYRWSIFTRSSPVKPVCLHLGCTRCVLSLKPSTSCSSE